MVLADRAAEIFPTGRCPARTCCSCTRSRPEWRDRIPAVVHVDGTARIQTVDPAAAAAGRRDPAGLRAAHRAAGAWSTPRLNTAGRPMVDDPRDALELFGSAPVDAAGPRPAPGPPRRALRRRGSEAGERRGRPMTGGQLAVVIPTVGRPSLRALLAGLAARHRTRGTCPRPRSSWSTTGRLGRRARRWRCRDAAVAGPRGPHRRARPGGGPQRRLAHRPPTPWVAFLDDDVGCPPDWSARAGRRPRRRDAGRRRGRRGGCGCRCRPTAAPPTGSAAPPAWRRAGGSPPTWPTGATRWREVSGFDERFPRAFREDADLALRVRQAGWRLVRGERRDRHPVRPADALGERARAGRQRRRRADAGPARADWRERAETGRGRFRWHVATVAGRGAGRGLGGRTAARGRPPLRRRRLARPDRRVRRPPDRARAASRRARAGPGVGDAWPATSAVIPRAAVAHRVAGRAARTAAPRPGRRRCGRCCSTATARWCTTCPTTATRRGCGRSTAPPRRCAGCARRGWRSAWSPTSPASPGA